MFPCFVERFLHGPVLSLDRTGPAVRLVFRSFLRVDPVRSFIRTKTGPFRPRSGPVIAISNHAIGSFPYGVSGQQQRFFKLHTQEEKRINEIEGFYGNGKTFIGKLKRLLAAA